MYEPDPALIRAASAGDTAAFEELVRAYQAHVWRFLRHLLGDATFAEDITQETFVRVYRKLETFRFRSKFSTWVFSVARNAGIDALRSRRRREQLITVVAPRAHDVASGGELGFEIESALQSLNPKLREAFVLIEALGAQLPGSRSDPGCPGRNGQEPGVPRPGATRFLDERRGGLVHGS